VRASGLHGGSGALLRVFDMAGRKVFEERVMLNGDQLDHAMDLRDTAPGSYLLQLSDDDATYVRSFIVGPSR